MSITAEFVWEDVNDALKFMELLEKAKRTKFTDISFCRVHTRETANGSRVKINVHRTIEVPDGSSCLTTGYYPYECYHLDAVDRDDDVFHCTAFDQKVTKYKPCEACLKARKSFKSEIKGVT